MLRSSFCRECLQGALTRPAFSQGDLSMAGVITNAQRRNPSHSRSLHLSPTRRDTTKSPQPETTPVVAPHPHDERNLPIILLVASLSKLFVRLGCSKFEVEGLERLVKVIKDESRRKQGRGLLTYANHISVLDEPLLWSSLPLPFFRDSKSTRWTLGAKDIMFTSPATSWLFGKGQVISTNRGQGIFQHAVDRSIAKLKSGNWVHIFPEGYVNMSRKMTLRRFKWGISRMIVESTMKTPATKPDKSKLPVILPIWITGFDQVMPEHRGWPRGLPRLGAKISVHFGEPLESSDVEEYLAAYEEANDAKIEEEHWNGSLKRQLPTTTPSPPHTIFPPVTPLEIPPDGWPALEENSPAALSAALDNPRKQEIRSRLAEYLRMKLAELGANVRKRRGEKGEGELVHIIEHSSESASSGP